jgi:hypothetical protein
MLKNEKVQSTKLKEHYAQGEKICMAFSMKCNNILPLLQAELHFKSLHGNKDYIMMYENGTVVKI